MTKDIRMIVGRLVSNANKIGALNERTLRVQWTPEPCSNVPIRSTWRDALGVPLTDARIERHELAGFYGESVRIAALAREAARTAKADAAKRRRALRERLERIILKRYH